MVDDSSSVNNMSSPLPESSCPLPNAAARKKINPQKLFANYKDRQHINLDLSIPLNTNLKHTDTRSSSSSLCSFIEIILWK